MSKPSPTKLSRKAYAARADELREELVQLQLSLKQAPFKVLVIVAGIEGAGRGALLQTLTEWLDPRGVDVFSWHPPTEAERSRPHPWRFWQSLPATGRIGLYAGSWYTELLREEARNQLALKRLAHETERIRDFEKLLSDSGTLIIKVWLALSKEAQGRRLRALRADPATAWRVTDEEWHHHKIHRRLAKTAALIRRRTDRPGAEWITIDAADERQRDLDVGHLIINRAHAHQRRLALLPPPKAPKKLTPLRRGAVKKLQAVRLDQELSDKAYDDAREKWLGRLGLAFRAAGAAQRAVVFVFEGWDAAGKGGAIRRLTSAADPRDYRVISVAKPTPEEKHAHYLWRFWRDIPADGRFAVYDRSWYGRVLVERIEGFCRPAEWRRAYDEINEFERELTDHGIILIKFWLHITHEEQLERFQQRERTPHKRHKLNDEDWRNRAKRPAYEIAVGDMLALTHRSHAPWHLVPADDKKFARIDVLSTAVRRIEAALSD